MMRRYSARTASEEGGIEQVESQSESRATARGLTGGLLGEGSSPGDDEERGRFERMRGCSLMVS
jgi:hypothetical protein